MTTIRRERRPATIADIPPTCTLSREGGRCCVSFVAPETAVWLALFQSLRATFPRHGDAYYRGKDRGWSLPGSRRAELEAWVWAHFNEDRVKGSLLPTEAVEGRGDKLALLQSRRDRMIRDLREMPDRGAVHRILKRDLADLDAEIGAEIERMAGR